MVAGDSSMQAKTGGFVQITGGSGTFNTAGSNGGSGGGVQINGGVGMGMTAANTGGSVALTGGTSQAGTGGIRRVQYVPINLCI